MAKKDKQIRQRYWFWRWMILSIIRFQKLYFLVWGILFLMAIICFKVELMTLFERLIK